jgi:hypothetical protein
MINQSNQKELKELDNILNKSKKKNANLKPVSSLNSSVLSSANSQSKHTLPDINKRLITQVPKLSGEELRKTFIKEKILIDCENQSNTSILSKSLINFDEAYDESKISASEMKFNNLIRDQLILEYHQVNDFLESIGLSKYVDIMIRNGYDDTDKIKTC